MDAGQNAGAAAATELIIGGMTCANCARHVTEAIQGVPGVAGATGQLDAGRATVRWKTAANAPAVVRAVEEAGYEASEVSQGATATAKSAWSPLSGWRFNVVVGLAATVPLMIG